MVRTAGRIALADGTAIGLAIGESVHLLRSSTAASRIVILLTDGENNVHDIEPGEAARIAESLGVRVYTVGVVTPPAFEELRTQVGVDEQSLREIASATGGRTTVRRTRRRCSGSTATSTCWRSRGSRTRP